MKQPEGSHGSPNGKQAEESCCGSSPLMGKFMMGMMKRFCGEKTEDAPGCCSMMEEMMDKMNGNAGANSSAQDGDVTERERK
jgi:hypothetical protein